MRTAEWFSSRWASLALLGLGLLQSVGFVTGHRDVRSFGWMSAASPLPIIFSSLRGVETFAADVFVTLEHRDGTRLTHRVTPELYSHLDCPCDCRNAYQAVLQYGPAVTKPDERKLVASAIRHGLCHDGLLAQSFGEVSSVERVRVRVQSRTREREGETLLELSCSD